MRIHLTLKQRFILFLVTLAGLSALTFLAVRNLTDATQILKAAQAQQYTATRLATDYKRLSGDMTRNVMAFVASGQPEFEDGYHAAMAAILDPQQGSGLMHTLRDAGFTADELQQVESAYTQTLTLSEQQRRAMNAVKGLFDDDNGGWKVGLPNEMMAKVMVFSQQYAKATADIDQAIDQFNQMQASRLSAEVDAASLAQRTAYLIAAAMQIALLLCSAWALWRLYLSIQRPLQQGIALAQQLAAGDLSAHISHQRRDELGRLLDALNATGHALCGTVGRVRERTLGIVVASHQIAQGNQNLERRTEQQASTLAQTSSAMTQLETAVRRNADDALRAQQAVSQAAGHATSGSRVMHDASQAMHQANEGSRRVAEIADLINSIAFQTNILALNAGVEAARAGKHGQGFNVVATEVRHLAQRTATAARDIERLIADSSSHMQAAAEQVEGASGIMRDVDRRIAEARTLMQQIAQACGEQSSDIAQMGDAIASVDDITRQNAQLVHEAANATRQQQDQADALATDVNHFQLESPDDPSWEGHDHAPDNTGSWPAAQQASLAMEPPNTTFDYALSSRQRDPSLARA